MRKGELGAGTFDRKRWIQAGALLVMMIVPVFLYIAAMSGAMGWLLGLFLVKAAAMFAAISIS